MNFWTSLVRPFFILAPMEDVTDTVFRRVILECSRQVRNEKLKIKNELGLALNNLVNPPSLRDTAFVKEEREAKLSVNNSSLNVLFTEFTNCEGIQSVGQSKLIHRLKYTEVERPIVAQVWGITPEDYFKTAKLVVELGFDGMDINMGCPVKAVIKQGACSALIKNPTLAKEIVLATKEGLGGKIPLSIKTRIGFAGIQTEEWCGFILKECRPAALTIHGRTVKEESKVENHWEEIGKVAAINEGLKIKKEGIPPGPFESGIPHSALESGRRLEQSYVENIQNGRQATTPEGNLKLNQNSTVIIGNGDVLSLDQGLDYAELYGLDGIMIGRGVFKNPWVFNPNVYQNSLGKLFWKDGDVEIAAAEKLAVLYRHADLFEKTWGNSKNYLILGKFLKMYVAGFEGAGELRQELNEFLSQYNKTREGDLAKKLAKQVSLSKTGNGFVV